MKKIRVLQIISNMGDGGAQKVVLNYLSNLKDDQSFDVKLLVLNSKKNSNYEYELEKYGYNVEYLNIPNIKIPLLHRFINFNFYGKRINKAIKKYNPDIIHIHLFGTLKIIGSTLKKCNTLNFYTLHSNPNRFVNLDLKIIKKALFKYNLIPICLNEEQAEIAKRHYGIGKYEIIHNGMEIAKIKSKMISKEKARKNFGLNKEEFVISTIGRLEPIKNYPLLLSIFKVILAKSKNSKLIFAGDGSEFNNLKDMAQKLQLDTNVIFLGNINNCEELLCASDVFVMTSISEGSPLALLEAQICDVYSVISSGVPSETIINDRVKQMSNDSTLEDWAESILDNKYVGKANFSIDDYDINLTSKKLKELYIKYLENKNDK